MLVFFPGVGVLVMSILTKENFALEGDLRVLRPLVADARSDGVMEMMKS